MKGQTVATAGAERTALLGGASRMALLTLSSTLALGVSVSGAAHAGAATVSPVQSATYFLQPGANPITFGPSTNINTANTLDAVDGGSNGSGWTITNQAGAVLDGGQTGISIPGAAATVTNAGSIIGRRYQGVYLGAGGAVTNQNGGSITGADEGVFINGASGVVTNQTGGSINSGFAGVILERGGVLTNQAGASIKGGYLGVGAYGPSLSITNSGSITAGSGFYGVGIEMIAGGSVTNTSTGVISGSSGGIFAIGGPANITNAGVIKATGGSYFYYLFNSGVVVDGGGSVTNLQGGTISGGFTGVTAFGGSVTVTNAGAIIGSTSGYGGAGVYLPLGGTVINQGGGTIEGETGVFITRGPGAVTNAGSIIGSVEGHGGAGVVLGYGGSVINQSGGTISGVTGVFISGGQGQVTNAGTIAGSDPGHSGLGVVRSPIGGDLGATGATSGYGVSLGGGGSVTNQAGGVISGEKGVYITGGAGQVVNAGQISGTAASVQFAGAGANSLTLQTGSSLVGDAIGSTAPGATNALVLQGSGSANNNFVNFNTLTVQASGRWTLNGASAIGATTISSGELQIGDAAHAGANLASAVTVDAGGVLSGHGTVTGSVTNDGGTVSPGGSIGTLTVHGDFTQTANGVLSLEADPSGSSTLAVTGAANLAGSVVLVTDPGNYRKGLSFAYLTAGSINGSFSSVTTSSGLSLGGPNLLTGTAVLLQGSFTNPGASVNQTALGDSLVSVPVGSGDFDTVANALLAIPSAAQQNAALDQLGGEIYADFLTVGRDSTRSLLGGISDQLSDTGQAGAGADPWIRAYGRFGMVKGDGDAHQFDHTSAGVATGVSRAWGSDITAGAAFGYNHTNLNLSGLRQQGSLDSWAGSLYGEKRAGVLFLDAAGSIAYDSGQSMRIVDLPGVFRRADGEFGGYAAGAMATVGARLVDAGVQFEPSASLIYSHVSQSGFTEQQGDGADLAVNSQGQDAVESLLQEKISKTFTSATGAVWKLDVNAAWAHEWDSTTPHITEAFAVGGGEPFTLAGATTGANAGVFGMGLSYAPSKRLTVFSRYEADLGDRHTDSTVTAGVRFAW